LSGRDHADPGAEDGDIGGQEANAFELSDIGSGDVVRR
jgi:hypothetical protein